jgi:hypothetical protein
MTILIISFVIAVYFFEEIVEGRASKKAKNSVGNVLE